MPYSFLTPGNVLSYEQAELSRQYPYRGEIWLYSRDHIFFRSRMGATPYPPKSPTPQGSFRNIASSKGSSAHDGRAGALEMVTQMPVDILHEIFCHLHPVDVLSLSRTTRSLRKILLEPHARGIWRRSLANIRGFPLCPPDLNEIQYASLAFDNFCTFCLATGGVGRVLWVCRVRCCQKCMKQQFASEDELDLWIPEDIYIEKPDSIFPCVQSSKSVEGRRKLLYFLPTTRKYLQELNDIAVSKDGSALSTWSQEKKDIQAMRITHAALCEYWNAHWSYRRPSRSSPSCVWEIVIVLSLILLLAVLWRQKLLIDA
ncbi:hypothetical protein M413DRAFT_449358 [Hebeloma cylindrosporum]|uniref:F-box domain-containing protein n=1 Tax=Hebeloma cylindrosporum TaxID=76867 RepID=A0A0C3BHI8_HEBCY|nr:hypothetical protein M413DRAFT_449358 [Hebeloma cylindrosporum h7]